MPSFPDIHSILKAFGDAASGEERAGQTENQTRQQGGNTPEYVLTDGLDRKIIRHNQASSIKPLAGRRYKIFKRVMNGEEETLQDVTEVAVIKTPLEDGGDLILLLDGSTRLIFQEFFSICDDLLCGVELPGLGGNPVVIDSSTPMLARGADGSILVYVFGDYGSLYDMAESFSSYYDVLDPNTWGGRKVAAAPVAEAAAEEGSSSMLFTIGGVGGLLGGVAAAMGGGGGSGGGGGGVPTPTPTPPTPTPAEQFITVRGLVVAGPVIFGHGLTAALYRADGTLLAGPVEVVSDGSFVLTFSASYVGAVIARVVDANSGVDYMDEAIGNAKDLVGDLRAAFSVTTTISATITISISPISELAVRLLGMAGGDGGTSQTTGSQLNVAKVAEVNAAVANVFGIGGDLLQSIVAVINTDGSANGSANYIGYVLATLSGLEALHGTEKALSAMTSALLRGDKQEVLGLVIAGANMADDLQSTVPVMAPAN